MKAPTKKSPPPKARAKKAPAPKPAAAPAAAKNPVREWVALLPAFAKAKPGESDLPDYKKKALPRGTRLTALLAEDAESYWRIKDGKIEGKALPRNIRVLEKAEWGLLPLAGEAVPGEALSGEALSAEAAVPPEQDASTKPPAAENLPEPPPTAEHASEPAPPAAPASDAPTAKLRVCFRGVGQIGPHLKPDFRLVEEAWFNHKKWGILPVARAVVLYEEAASPAGRALLEKMPGMPPNRFISDINTAASDVYILQFAWEALSLLYKSKSTGMILPLKYDFIGMTGFDKIDYQTIAGRAAAAGLTEDDWRFLQEEFEFVGPLNDAQLSADIGKMFEILRRKIVIVVMLNTKVGHAGWLLKLYQRINDVVRPMAEAHGVAMIDINEFVLGTDDLAQQNDNGASFKPRIYAAVAERVKRIIAEQGQDKTLTPPV